jgi:hypothetical protein
MRQRLAWLPAESLPGEEAVLRLQGVPLDRPPSPRVVELLAQARAAHLATAEPRAIVEEIAGEEFAAVYRGEGRNAPETPLAEVLSKAGRLALFAATVGERETAEIRALFARNEPALAAMLDSVASAAADRLACELLPCLPAWTGVGGAGGWRVLPYSPGYCGWHVTGQRALFARLRPAEIGITLNDSCLMQPLKSVSGVLVAGPAEIHGFAPAYPFCGQCRNRTCLGRGATSSD